MTRDQTPATWRKSSFSNSQAACVEVANLDGHRGVRDSKQPTGPVLTVTVAEWSAFTAGVQSGEFGG